MPTFTTYREASKDEMGREIDRCHKVIADLEARAEAAEAKCRLLVDAAPHHVLSSYAYRARIAELEARLAQSPEVTAEEYIQGMIDKAPEPLRRLGEWLANVLDDDQWKTAERMLNGAVVSGMASDVQARLRQSRDQVGRLQSQVDRHKHEREEAEARLVKEIDSHMETARRLARAPDREAVARALHERVWEDRECLGDACFGGSLSCICIGKLADAAIAAMQERAPDREAVALREFAEWVDAWVSNPAGSYSMSALEGLFMMTRDRLAAMQETKP